MVLRQVRQFISSPPAARKYKYKQRQIQKEKQRVSDWCCARSANSSTAIFLFSLPENLSSAGGATLPIFLVQDNLCFWFQKIFVSLVRVCPVWCFSTPSGAGQWAPILSGSGLTLCYSIFMDFKILADQATKGMSAVSQPLFLPGAAGQLEVRSYSH